MNDPNKNNAPAQQSFNERLRYETRHLTAWIGSIGLQAGIHPDAITTAGLLITLFAAILVAFGWFLPAGLLLIFGSILDVADGAVARALGRKNRFGGLLDSTLDRYADGFMFGALAYYFAAQGQLTEMIIALIALIGAYTVSYVRARAEGLNIGSIKDGYFDRFTRTLVLIVMLLTGWIVPGLLILAVGNHVTTVQRLLIARETTRNDGL